MDLLKYNTPSLRMYILSSDTGCLLSQDKFMNLIELKYIGK